MPNFLGHFFGVSFRTERLIMNIIGLVNSTLDWHPLKWTNKLEQIWNLSLSRRTHILDTIGEDRIKAILSYIVIARILIAHVFTLSYMTNFYPIITWSRPNLLLPWLILSFFKNVVLEVIVIAVGLLLWYDRRFSLPIFLEFVVVKVVPLAFAAYNWYSNSCLYLELRRFERMRRLRRNMRSDSNLIASRLYLKIADSKYKTRSVTTLISWSSYDTYDTNDTISRIIENPNLTPAQKAMRILGITEHDVHDARTRVRERTMHQRLTEVEDEDENNSLSRARDMRRYFAMISQYEFDMETLLPPRNESTRSSTGKDEDTSGELATGTSRNNVSTKQEPAENDSTVNSSSSSPANGQSSENPGNPGNPRNASSASPRNNPSSGDPEISTDDPASSPNDVASGGNPGGPKNDPFVELNSSAETRSSTKNSGDTDSSTAKESREMKLGSSRHVTELRHSLREASRLYGGKNARESVDGSCSPVKLQSMLNCNCTVDECMAAEKMEECCLSNYVRARTSTPNGRPNGDTELDIMRNDFRYSKDFFQHLCESDCARVVETLTLAMSEDPPLAKASMEQEPSAPRSLDSRNDRGLEDNLTVDGKIDREVLAALTNEPETVAEGARDSPGIPTSLNVSEDFETSKAIGGRENATELDYEVSRTLVPVKCAINPDTTSRERSILAPYARNNDQNLVNVSRPKYSFIDTNIPRFYKDSMKVFDGCYEKDFANNSEVQCLLQQLEKKNWSLFHGETNRDMLIPSGALMQNEQFAVQDLRSGYHLTNDFENIDRYEISLSSSSKTNYDQPISLTPRTNEHTLDDVSSMVNESPNPIHRTLTKNVYTQTNDDDVRSRSSSSSLVKSKRRGKPFLKRKRLKDENRNGSPINVSQHRNTDTQSSSGRKNSRASLRPRPFKPADNQRKQPQMPKSLSDRSVCECRMPQADGKHSNHSSEWKFDRRPGTKCKVESYGTVTLPQVAKPSMFDTVIYRRKPPVYPKKSIEAVPAQANPSAASSKKMSALKKLLEVTARRSTEKQPACGSRKFKWKTKPDSGEGQEARELRALKAYNEVTLLRDKQELEARRKLSSRRSSLDRVSQATRSRVQARKINADRSRSDTPRTMDTVHSDKENLCVDATTETERFDKPLSRGWKANAGAGKFGGASSSERYPCAKLSKVNKVTDQLLDNFDRLHGRSANQDARKVTQAAETSTRKQYTKYSKPNKLSQEENVSVVSIKRLEGTQNGRELERTQAREDVRDALPMFAVPCAQEQRESIADVASTFLDEPEVERKEGTLFSTIKSVLFQDIISTWSSTTVDQTDEAQHPVPENANAEREARTAPELDDGSKREEIEAATGRTEVSPVSSTSSIEPAKRIELDSNSKGDEERALDSSRTDSQRLVPTDSHTFESDNFVRNIDVAYMGNYVVLTNPSAPKDAQPQRRTILDDDTIRMLQHAFSDRSLYFIFDLSRELLSMADVPHGLQFGWDNEFIFQPNRETMGVAMEDLPPLAHEGNRFEQTILAAIRQFQRFEGSNEEDDSRDVFVATIGHENLSIDVDLETVDEFDDDADETVEHVRANELEINEVLSTVFGALRCLNVDGLQLNTSFDLTYEILQDTFDDEDSETDVESEAKDEEDEKEEETRRMIEARLLRFVKEDIFTDIKFPIVVKWSDVIVGGIEASAELFEERDIGLTEIEPSKVNLFSFDEREEMDVGEAYASAGFRALEQTAGTSGLRSGRFSNLNDRVSSGYDFTVDRLEDGRADNRYFGESSNDPYGRATIVPGAAQSYGNHAAVEMLNKTYDLLVGIEEANANDAPRTSYEIEAVESSRHEQVDTDQEDTETITNEGEFAGFEYEKLEETESSTIEESLESVENEFLEKLQTIQGNRTFSAEYEEEDGEGAVSETISLKIIFTFWFLVVYFYIRHFYRKIFTFGRASGSTSTLKPFEIHAVPTSTTALLENAELAEKLREEAESNTEEYEVEESDLLKGIIDLEEEEEEEEEEWDGSVSKGDVSPLDTDGSVFENVSDDRSDAEEVKVLRVEYFPSNESVSKWWSDANDRSSVESLSKERTDGIESGRAEIDSDLESRYSARTRSLITDHGRSDDASKDVPAVPQLDERKRLELRLAGEEIEALRYKGDECSSDEDERESYGDTESNFARAERGTEVMDVASNPDEIQKTKAGIEEFVSFESSKEGFENVDTGEPHGTALSERNVREANVSTEENRSERSGQTLNMTMQSRDSFDSTYTMISDASKCTESVVDLIDSSMEDFKADESIDSD